MSSLPSLTKTDVRNWTEQRFFDRGEHYTDRARALIEQRGRSNYADAGDLLVRVKTLYDRMDDLESW